jgi:hypothetical protein
MEDYGIRIRLPGFYFTIITNNSKFPFGGPEGSRYSDFPSDNLCYLPFHGGNFLLTNWNVDEKKANRKNA